MTLLLLKAQVVVTRHRKEVVVVLAVLGIVLLGISGWMFANPGTTDVDETRHEQTFRSTLGSSAVVAGGTSIWEPGTTLHDRHVYLRSATPTIELNSTTQVPADQSVDVSQRVTLVYQVTRSGRTVWESEEMLLADSTRVEDGVATSRATVNVTRIHDRVATIEDEFTGVGSVSAHLRTDVNYRTDQYEGTLNATGPITFTDRAVAIDEYPATEQTRAETVTVTKQSPRDWPLIGGVTTMSALSLFGAWWIGRRDEPMVDVAVAEKRLERARYRQWISDGTFPQRIGKNAVEMESLDSLVNLAIDSKKRVIHDAEKSEYGVLDGETIYYHTETEREEPPLFDDVAEPDEEAGDPSHVLQNGSNPESRERNPERTNGDGDTDPEHTDGDEESEENLVVIDAGNTD